MTGRYQLYLLELAPGLFFRDVLSAEDNLLLLNPFLFGREETNLPKIRSYQEPKEASRSDMWKPGLNMGGEESFVAHCQSCHQGQILDVRQLSENYDQRNEGMVKKETMKTIRALVLTDCANAYSSICGLTAGPAEKSCRLLLAHIRDNPPTVSLSYLGAIFNVADLGAKLRASRLIWRPLISTGLFRISFFGQEIVEDSAGGRWAVI